MGRMVYGYNKVLISHKFKVMYSILIECLRVESEKKN